MFLMMITIGGGITLVMRCLAMFLQLVRGFSFSQIDLVCVLLLVADGLFLYLLVHSCFYLQREHPYIADSR